MKIAKHAKRQAKQLYRLCLVNNLIDERRVRDVVQSVISSGQHDGPAVLTHLVRLLKFERAQHTAMIESAAPLSADVQTAIQTGLASRYGQGLATVYTQQPALIGGVRIQVGCDVYDESVRARLAALESGFLKRGNYG